MTTVTAVTRQFLYGGRALPDPNPSMSPEEVKGFYAGVHPELLNASIEGGEFDGATQTWRFERGVGTKG